MITKSLRGDLMFSISMKETQSNMISSSQYSLVRKPALPPCGRKHYDVMTPSDSLVSHPFSAKLAESIRNSGARKQEQ
jgi:hypothetical protein